VILSSRLRTGLNVLVKGLAGSVLASAGSTTPRSLHILHRAADLLCGSYPVPVENDTEQKKEQEALAP
jgi:hypothetical protein